MYLGIDPVDLFHAHVGGIDTLARDLQGAARMLEGGALARLVEERYAGWSGQLGRSIRAGEQGLESLAALVDQKQLDPRPVSGQQERLENLVNSYL